MKRDQIKVGGLYIAKVASRLTTVRVDSIKEGTDWRGKPTITYHVTNLTTQRKTIFHSAMKFRMKSSTEVAAVASRPTNSGRVGQTSNTASAAKAPASTPELRKHLEKQDELIAKSLGESMSEHGYCTGDEPDCCEADPMDDVCVGCGKMIRKNIKEGKQSLPFVKSNSQPKRRLIPLGGKKQQTGTPNGLGKPTLLKNEGLLSSTERANLEKGSKETQTQKSTDVSASPVKQQESTREEREAKRAKNFCPICNGFGTLRVGGRSERCKACGGTGQKGGKPPTVEEDDSLKSNYVTPGEDKPDRLHKRIPKKPCLLAQSQRAGEDEQSSDPHQNHRPTPTSATTSSTICATGVVQSEEKSTNQSAESSEGSNILPMPQPSLSTLLKKSIEQVTAQPKRIPTAEQQAIIAKAKTQPPILIVGAGAGTGKTSTCVMLEEVIQGVGQYTAFNASLVADSKTRFKRVSCNTIHSLAFRSIGKRYAHRLGGRRVRSYEVAQMLGVKDMLLPNAGMDVKTGKPCDKNLTGYFLAGQVLAALKKFSQSADKAIDDSHFRYIDGIDPVEDGHKTYENNREVISYLYPFALKAWEDIENPEGTLPFNHDYYVKIWELTDPEIACDFLLIDEAQDLSEVMLSIIRQNDQCMRVLVGDDNQQIYEWRGAINAMKEFPDAPRLWLTQSFRFGQAIADVANSILKTLQEPAELRLKGLPSIESNVVKTVGGLENPKCVLFRTNAAAVARLLNDMSQEKRDHLIGGGAEVLSFVRGAKDLKEGRPSSHQDLACFNSWSEVEEYVKEAEGEDLKLLVKLIKEFGCDKIIAGLENMPPEESAHSVICTAHKCVAPDTLVETTMGIVPILNLKGAGTGEVGTPDGPKDFYGFVEYSVREMLTFRTSDGYEVSVTEDHGLEVWTGIKYERVEAKNVKQGQFLRLLLEPGVPEPNYEVALPDSSEIYTDIRAVRYKLPTILTEIEAFLFGTLVADGCVFKKGVRYSKAYRSAAEAVAEAWEKMGVPAEAKPRSEMDWMVEVHSTHIPEWLKKVGGMSPHDKQVPDCIWLASTSCQKAFLRGVFSDGTVGIRRGMLDVVSLTTCFPKLAFNVQYLLRRLGIISRRFLVKSGRFQHWRVEMYSTVARKFLEDIGFPDSDRTKKGLEAEVTTKSSGYPVPVSWREAKDARSEYTKQNARYRGYVSRTILERDLPDLVDRLRFHHDKVVEIEKYNGPAVCVTVPDGNRFLQNGFDGWNSKGREWESVQLGNDFPLNKNEDDEKGRTADDSERRLLYVAATRAKITLDISICPFFTGKSGLEIVKSIPGDSSTVSTEPLPLGSGPNNPKVAPTIFNWAKLDAVGGGIHKGWGIRGPVGHKVGDVVEVVKASGAKTKETIKGIVHIYHKMTYYKV
jgi:intein/homing endonuclease/ribosomal protein L37AE/L43A